MSDNQKEVKGVMPVTLWQFTNDERLPPKFVCDMVDSGKLVPCGNGLHIHDADYSQHVDLNEYLCMWKSGKVGVLCEEDFKEEVEIMQ